LGFVLIPFALFAYRTIQQQTTRFEPFYLIYGRDALLPIEIEIPNLPDNNDLNNDFQAQLLERIQLLTGTTLNDNRQIAQDNITKSQEKQKLQYDVNIHPIAYQIGDQVLLQNFYAKKLDAKWLGPYYIHDNRKTNGTYQL
jgi:hypothetical protein